MDHRNQVGCVIGGVAESGPKGPLSFFIPLTFRILPIILIDEGKLYLNYGMKNNG